MKRKATRGPKARNWCFTHNNSTELWSALPKGVKYVTHQVEKAPTTGTLHVQGYVQLEKPQYVSFLQKLRKCSWFVAKGSLEQNNKYTQKGPTSVGEPVVLGEPTSQGKRSDLESFRTAVKAGKRRRDLFDSHINVMARYPRLYDNLSALVKPEKIKRKVIVLYGDPGTGKTHYVWDKYPEHYSIPPADHMWLPGYDGHETVLWDDFAGAASKISLRRVLNILDDYPLQLERKGGHVWFNPSLLFITTNVSPEHWYNYNNRDSERWALSRRVDELWTFTHKSVLGTDKHEIVKYKTEVEIKKFF